MIHVHWREQWTRMFPDHKIISPQMQSCIPLVVKVLYYCLCASDNARGSGCACCWAVATFFSKEIWKLEWTNCLQAIPTCMQPCLQHLIMVIKVWVELLIRFFNQLQSLYGQCSKSCIWSLSFLSTFRKLCSIRTDILIFLHEVHCHTKSMQQCQSLPKKKQLIHFPHTIA